MRGRGWVLTLSVGLSLSFLVPVIGHNVGDCSEPTPSPSPVPGPSPAVGDSSPPVEDCSPPGPPPSLINYLYLDTPAFSPNNDLRCDLLSFSVGYSSFFAGKGWDHQVGFEIRGVSGSPVIFSWSEPGSFYWRSWGWEGRDTLGNTLPDGDYRVVATASVQTHHGLIQDSRWMPFKVDTVAPVEVSHWPDEQSANVSADVATIHIDQNVSYTAATEAYVRATFNESLGYYSRIRVVSQAGIPAVDGYSRVSYLDPNTVEWDAILAAGHYRAFVHGEDLACNATDFSFDFIEVGTLSL